jgi:hypothetical protein
MTLKPARPMRTGKQSSKNATSSDPFKVRPFSTNVLDYSSSMSMYEIESLAAERSQRLTKRDRPNAANPS